MNLAEYVAAYMAKLTAAGLTLRGEKKLDYGLQLTVTDEAESIAVNIYSGKKGISVVVGGSPASSLKQVIQAIADGDAAPVEAGNPPGFETVTDFDGRWIGTDESGKGDFFGPLVVAAVRVDIPIAASLQAAGVKDSKALTDAKAKVLAERIREICRDGFVELEIMPARYNTLYDQFRSENKNLNHLLAWAHARVLEDLLQKTPCRFALADKFADEKYIQARLMDKGRQIVLVQTPKAERNVAVAAASVLARDRFLRRIDDLSAGHGLVFPKGASQQVIDAARLFVQSFGKPALRDVAKVHFKTVDAI